MNSESARYLVTTLLLLVAASQGALAESPAETLAELSTELSAVRAASSAEPVWSRFVDVSMLSGLTREDVQASLGDADLCEGESTDDCDNQSWWGYFFYYLPDGWRGGGPELWLEFDAAGILTLARWYVSR